MCFYKTMHDSTLGHQLTVLLKHLHKSVKQLFKDSINFGIITNYIKNGKISSIQSAQMSEQS